MEKLYNRIVWHNDTNPAINEDNLNRMDIGIDAIDTRVCDLAGTITEDVPAIQEYLEQSEDLVQRIETMTKNPPYIGANGNWYVFNTNTMQYEDSGIDASITVEIADITMIPYIDAPYVTNSGTNTDPIFHLFLPRAATIASVDKTAIVGNVDTYTMTLQDGSTFNFTVTNGTGSGDMKAVDYDPNGTVASNGGIIDYGQMRLENGLIEGTGHTYGPESPSRFKHIEGSGNTIASDAKNAHVEGVGNSMGTCDSAHIEGVGNTIFNEAGHIEGQHGNNYGFAAHVEGMGSCVGYNGQAAHAEGYLTTALSQGAHAEGIDSYAAGAGSHTEGAETTTRGRASHAEGSGTLAHGNNSHSEGVESTAVGVGSHTEGTQSYAYGNSSHAEGDNTEAQSRAAHAEGYNTNAQGEFSHAEGYQTHALGDYSHTEGGFTYSEQQTCHAEGAATSSVGYASHSEGSECLSQGTFSHAEGGSTTAQGAFSHAGGNCSFAGADCSFAHGYFCVADQDDSAAFGTSGIAYNENSSLTRPRMFAIGSPVQERSAFLNTMDVQHTDDSKSDIVYGTNAFSVDINGNTFMRGAPFTAKGVLYNRLIADGDYYVLEDGAAYVLWTNTRMINNNAWRGAQAYFIVAPFAPHAYGEGASTTALAVAQHHQFSTIGTAGLTLKKDTVSYTTPTGGTAYHARIGIGSCVANCCVRYALIKVIGSELDMMSNYN